MCVQRRRVRVIAVDHRQAQPGLERAADVESAPGRVAEVHRAPAGSPADVIAGNDDAVRFYQREGALNLEQVLFMPVAQ
jgi:hypothetical protein